MNDPGAIPNNTPVEGLENGTERMEDRLRRLEDAVAAMQDTRMLEERVVQRVTEQMPPPAPPPSATASGVMQASRHLLPLALDAVRSQMQPPEPAAASHGHGPREPWLMVEAIVEVRAIWYMFVDPRYRMSWPARLVPLALLAAILTSWIWLPGISFLPTAIGAVIDKLVDLVLAYFLIKMLVREARRYREALPDPFLAPRA